MLNGFDSCAPRTHSPYFTFIPMGKLALNYASSEHTPRIKCDSTVSTQRKACGKAIFFLSIFLSLLFYFEFFYLLTENAEGCYISSHSMTHTHSIWLLWTRDRLVAATLPDDRHTKAADIHAPAGIQTWNRSKRPADTHALDGATTGVRSRATWRANNHHTNFRGD